MTEAPDLSICIVNWNGREMLRRLLQSIAAATDPVTREVVVVDNASTDGSVEIVAAEFPGARWLRNEQNVGCTAGYNQAAQVTRGRHLLFMNNDTVIRPGAMAKLVAFLDTHPEYSSVGPCLIGGDDKPQWTGRGFPTLGALLHRIAFLKWTGLFRRAYRDYRRGDFEPDRSSNAQQLSGSAFVVRRKHYNAIVKWDEGFEFGLEDVDLCARLLRCGPIYYLREAEIVHFGRISSRANRSFVYRGFECGYARFLRKHRSRAAAIIYKMLVTLDMPVRLALLGLHLMWYRFIGRRDRMDRCRQELSAATSFALSGLPRFWRA